MRGLKVISGATMMVLVAVVPAARAEVSGNDLHSYCTSTDPFQIGLCMGYIIGAADTATTSVKGRRCGFFNINAEAGVTNQQVLDVVKNFLAAHPEERHYGSEYLTLRALQESFPCTE